MPSVTRVYEIAADGVAVSRGTGVKAATCPMPRVDPWWTEEQLEEVAVSYMDVFHNQETFEQDVHALYWALWRVDLTRFAINTQPR